MNAKSTRRALTMSVISLLICVAMLMGTTFAWFTDSVTSGRNTIVAGNLDVVLEYFDGTDFAEVTDSTKLFNDTSLWEPGHTEVAYLKVSNVGTLALKYQLAVNVFDEKAGTNVANESFNLSDHLVFKVVDIDEADVGTYTRDTAKTAAGTVMGLGDYNSGNKTLMPKGKGVDSACVALVVYMPETVGNEANYLTGTDAPYITMGTTLVATQVENEVDSFGNDYDAGLEPDATFVFDTDGLKNAIDDYAKISLTGGSYKLPSLANKNGVTIIGAVDGSTKMDGVNSFSFGEDTTIKNVTFTTNGGHSVRYGSTKGDVVYDNCVFEGKQYGYHVDNANGGTITFNNCTFYGRNALASNGTYVFNNCTFKYTYSNYNTTNIYSTATFNNCKWDSKLELYIDSGAKAIVDGDEITQRTVFISDAKALESFQQSVNWKNNTYAGVTVMLSSDIDMNDAYYANWTPIGQTGATQFMGTFDGHGYTIKNLNVNCEGQTGANFSSGLFGWLNKATVKNVTFENATVKGNHNVGVVAGYMETSGCTIENCHVIGATVTAKHANDDACGDKVGAIVGHAGNAGVKVANCSAENVTITAGRDAGQIVGAALSANVTGCEATNVTVTAGGDCTGANVNNALIGRVLG